MTGANTRWLVSFADLLMLLLAFFVVIGATRVDRVKVGEGMRAAFGGAPAADGAAAAVTLDPARLFEPGEAVLRAGAAARIAAVGRRFGTRAITLTSAGDGGTAARLDRFELAAARTAAIGRALGRPAGRIAIAMRPAAGQAQRVTVTAAP